MINQAVILVGGKGERLNDGFRFDPAIETPKPLMEVGGKPFITYAINYLRGIGIEDIVLLVGYRRDCYELLWEEDRIVRLVDTQEDVDQAILSIPGLENLFLLLNGDCFPVMDWRDFICTGSPRVALKVVGRDAGVALVSRDDVSSGVVSCGDISGMLGCYENYTILGGLHIGTYQGLARARLFMDTIVFGQ